MRIRGFPAPAVGLLFGMLIACAPAATVDPARADGAGAETIPIQVQHDAPTAVSLTIFLVDGVGARRLLGMVSPAQTVTFEVPEDLAAGPHILVAEGAPGGFMRSRSFNLAIRDGVRWILSTNMVTSLVTEDP